ncbi:MAG: HEAT repeat domain-containing protein [Candidatus Marinimicrobia bacterium]|nr:HEAT repeat domain-containing protein [Candidatus Neomarinimicrobiota bacterium]
MVEFFSTFVSGFIHGSEDRVILIILVVLTSVFLLVITVLFFITVYLRIHNKTKVIRQKRLKKQWDPYLLAVMDGTLSPRKAFTRISKRNSLTFLLYLEDYIRLLRGKEKERLEAMGRMSSKKLESLLHCPFRRRRYLGLHLLILFHGRIHRKVRLDPRDMDMSLLSIRELQNAPEVEIKKQIIQILYKFPYLSPVYMSNILAGMGVEIIPVLRDIIKNRKDRPFMQIVAIDALRRMHDADSLRMTDQVLHRDQDPGVLRTWLKYIEDQGDRQYFEAVRNFISHPRTNVRMAAIRAYIELSDRIGSRDIIRFFNDPSVNVAVNAAEKLRDVKQLPHFSIEEIREYRWADIYLRMVY